MPEIIEVELYRRAALACVGRQIVGLDLPDPHYAGPLGAKALADALVGSTVTAVGRHGKLLLVATDERVLGMRFGMTGRLIVDDAAPIASLRYAPTGDDGAYRRVVLCFADGGAVAVSDPRRLGSVELDPDVSRLGPDALGISRAALRSAVRGSSVAVKARLLDQARVAGIGNLLGDEILWRARISPLRPTDDLTGPMLRRLHDAIATVIPELMERGGSHLGDLIEARAPGGRCPRCQAPLRRATIGGRTTWWCPREQR